MLPPVALELSAPPEFREAVLADLRRAALEIRRFSEVLAAAEQTVRVTVQPEESRWGSGFLITVEHLEQKYTSWTPADSVRHAVLQEFYFLADPDVYSEVARGSDYEPRHPKLNDFREGLAELAHVELPAQAEFTLREFPAELRACEELLLRGDVEAARRGLLSAEAEPDLLSLRLQGLLAARRLGDDLPRLVQLLGRCRSMSRYEPFLGTGLRVGEAERVLRTALEVYGLAPVEDVRTTVQDAFGPAWLQMMEQPPAGDFPWARWGTLVRAQQADGIDILRRALEVEPDFLEARWLRAMLLAGLDQRAEALAELDRVLELDATYGPALTVAASLLADDPASWARALDLAERALELNPWDAGALALHETVSRLMREMGPPPVEDSDRAGPRPYP